MEMKNRKIHKALNYYFRSLIFLKPYGALKVLSALKISPPLTASPRMKQH